MIINKKEYLKYIDLKEYLKYIDLNDNLTFVSKINVKILL